MVEEFAHQFVQHTENFAEVDGADDGRQHCDRDDPVFQPHDAENFRQHQRQVQQQPAGVEVHFQQAAGGVGTQQKNQQQP